MPEEWSGLFGDPLLASAGMDRLTHGANRLVTQKECSFAATPAAGRVPGERGVPPGHRPFDVGRAAEPTLDHPAGPFDLGRDRRGAFRQEVGDAGPLGMGERFALDLPL